MNWNEFYNLDWDEWYTVNWVEMYEGLTEPFHKISHLRPRQEEFSISAFSRRSNRGGNRTDVSDTIFGEDHSVSKPKEVNFNFSGKAFRNKR